MSYSYSPWGGKCFGKNRHIFCFLLQIENEGDSEAKSMNRKKWVINLKTIVDVYIYMSVKVPFNRISDHMK